MVEETFINEFLTIGLNDFFENSSSISFEKHIIECLVDIYGMDKIKEVYMSKNVNAFQPLIQKYGLKTNVYENFLRDTRLYETFKKENAKKPNLKSDYASIVEVDIITMFLQKCLVVEPTLEELSHFENNLLNDFSIIKLHYSISKNPNRTREYWNKKKKILMDNVELIEVKPEYLDEYTYARYGIDIKNVKKMDYQMVNELNKYIKNKMENKEESGNNGSSDLIIASGSGYVNMLLILSIVATILSIGAILIFLKVGAK